MTTRSKSMKPSSGSLLLTLSRNDPLDASYFLMSTSARDDKQPTKPLYVVSTKTASSSSLGASARVTTIDRLILPAPPARPRLDVLARSKAHNRASRRSLGPSPLSVGSNQNAQLKFHWSSTSASSSAGTASGSDGERVRVAIITRPALAFALFAPVTISLGGQGKEKGKAVPAKEYLRKAGLLSGCVSYDCHEPRFDIRINGSKLIQHAHLPFCLHR